MAEQLTDIVKKTNIDPKTTCCDQLYIRYDHLASKLYSGVWTPKRKDDLAALSEELAALEDHYCSCEPNHILSGIRKARKDCNTIRSELYVKHTARSWLNVSAGTWCKRALLAGTISFLTFSTVRYWSAIAYPKLREQGVHNAISPSPALAIPPNYLPASYQKPAYDPATAILPPKIQADNTTKEGAR